MKFISSDTSVWIDFSTIHRIQLPFRLPYTFIMSRDAVVDELLSPPGLGEELMTYGLVPVDITIEEFFLAQRYGSRYTRLSTYDRVALAIAKERKNNSFDGGRGFTESRYTRRRHHYGYARDFRSFTL